MKRKRKLKKSVKGFLLGTVSSVILFTGFYLTGEDASEGTYYKAFDFARDEHYEPTTLKVQNGDILYRNGIEILVFNDVVTGEYTLTTSGYFELYRQN